MSTHLGSAHVDPADDDTPASNSHEAKATTFAEAISKVLKMNNSSKPKLWEPDPFHGSNSRKLCIFILQCKLNFWDRRDLFEDDTNKVNYVLSFLKGNLASWILLNPHGFQISIFSLRNLKPTLEPMIQSVKQKWNLKDSACTKAIRLQSTLSNSRS